MAAEPSTALVLEAEAVGASVTLFRTDDPAQIIARAVAVATPLAEVIRKQGLAKSISGKEYVFVEGWTLLGTMLGVFPVVVEAAPMPGTARTCKRVDRGAVTEFEGFDWHARVEARTSAGAVVGSAVAVCSRTEAKWENDAEYAVCSMAQTRATSKALRLPLGFVMKMAGFEATPADEIPDGGFTNTSTPAQSAPVAPPASSPTPVPSAPAPPPAPARQKAGKCPTCGALRVFKSTKMADTWVCVKDAKSGIGCWTRWSEDPTTMRAAESPLSPSGNPEFDAHMAQSRKAKPEAVRTAVRVEEEPPPLTDADLLPF